MLDGFDGKEPALAGFLFCAAIACDLTRAPLRERLPEGHAENELLGGHRKIPHLLACHR